jgi:cell division protease FtsH
LNNLLKNIGIWLVIGLVVLTVFKQFDARQPARESVPYSEFMEKVRAGGVESAQIEGRKILWVSSTDKKKSITYSPNDLWMVAIS